MSTRSRGFKKKNQKLSCVRDDVIMTEKLIQYSSIVVPSGWRHYDRSTLSVLGPEMSAVCSAFGCCTSVMTSLWQVNALVISEMTSLWRANAVVTSVMTSRCRTSDGSGVQRVRLSYLRDDVIMTGKHCRNLSDEVIMTGEHCRNLSDNVIVTTKIMCCGWSDGSCVLNDIVIMTGEHCHNVRDDVIMTGEHCRNLCDDVSMTGERCVLQAQWREWCAAYSAVILPCRRHYDSRTLS